MHCSSGYAKRGGVRLLLPAMLLLLASIGCHATRTVPDTTGDAAAVTPASLFRVKESSSTAGDTIVDATPQVMTDGILGTVPIPTGVSNRVLVLDDDVLDSAELEVAMPMLPGKNFIVVWDADKQAGKIKTLRKKMTKLQKKLKKQLKKQSKGQPANEDGADIENQLQERITMTGILKGYGHGETAFILVVSGESFLATVSVPELQDDGNVITRIYQIRSMVGDANAGLVSAFTTPDLGHLDAVIAEPQTDGRSGPMTPVEMPAPVSVAPAGRKLLEMQQIDILMLFTPAAMKKMSSSGSEAAAMDAMAAEVQLMNTIYANTQLNVRLNMVRAAQVQYTETSFEKSLNDLRTGAISGSASLRDSTGADLVQLITTDTAYCGIGYQPSSPNSNYAFTVVQTGCLMSGTGAHEVGHNMGCGHDYYSDPNQYSGWSNCDIDTPSRFSTIMSYGCQFGTRPTRLLYHSNPAVSVTRTSGTYPTGNVNTANCAASITKNAQAVSNFRPSAGGGGGAAPPPPAGNTAAPPPAPPPPQGSGTQNCAGGGTCSGSTVCSRYNSQDVCCPSSYPVWCGGNSCYSAGTNCGGSTSSPPPKSPPSKSPPSKSPPPKSPPPLSRPPPPQVDSNTCVGGGTCSGTTVCARFNFQDVCCPISYPTWCGGNSCYSAGTDCGGGGGASSPPPKSPPPLRSPPPKSPPPLRSPPPPSPVSTTETCAGGGKCQSPYTCVRYNSQDACCPKDSPVWCGGSSCYSSGYQCPGSGSETCSGGGRCDSGTVCASYQNVDVCCPSNLPVWCGGNTCLAAGATCNRDDRCPSGAACSAGKVCASYGGQDACCSSNYPVWCGGNRCYRDGTTCSSQDRIVADVLAVGSDAVTTQAAVSDPSDVVHLFEKVPVVAASAAIAGHPLLSKKDVVTAAAAVPVQLPLAIATQP